MIMSTHVKQSLSLLYASRLFFLITFKLNIQLILSAGLASLVHSVVKFLPCQWAVEGWIQTGPSLISFIWACLYEIHKWLMWDIKLNSISFPSADKFVFCCLKARSCYFCNIVCQFRFILDIILAKVFLVKCKS